MLKRRGGITPLEVAALVLPIVVFAGVVAVFQAVFGNDPDRPVREEHLSTLSALAHSPPGALALTSGTEERVLSEPADIAEFLGLLLEPEVIPYHHSHPEDGLRLQFAGQPIAYALGPDSQAPDEYWLELAAGPNSGLTLKLFRSTALTAWLIRHGFIQD